MKRTMRSLALGSALMLAMVAGIATMASATPWFTQDPRTLPQGKWRVEEHVMFAEANGGLSDDRDAPLPGGAREVSTLNLHTRVRYGVTDDLTLFADLPLITKRLEAADGSTQSNTDLGDVVVLAKYQYHQEPARGRRQGVAALVKTDTGDSTATPALLATGSGQTSVGLLHLWEWREASSTWYASAGYLWTDERSDTGRDPGDQVLFNLAAEHPLRGRPMNLVWEINGVYEGHAESAGKGVANTGSTLVSFTPGVQYNLSRGATRITLEAGVQVPVVKRGDLPVLNDYQAYMGGYVIF